MSEDTEPLAIGAGRNLLPWDGDRGPGQPPATVVVDQQSRHRHARSAGRGTSVVFRTGVGMCMLGVLLGIVVVLRNDHPAAETDPSVADTGSMNRGRQPATSSDAMSPAAVSTTDPTSFGGVIPAATPAATPTAARTVQPIVASSPAAAPVTPTRLSGATPAITTLPPSATPSSTPSAGRSCWVVGKLCSGF